MISSPTASAIILPDFRVSASRISRYGQTAGLALLKAFGYDPRRFKGVVARTLLFPEPVSQNIKFINNVNGVPTRMLALHKRPADG